MKNTLPVPLDCRESYDLMVVLEAASRLANADHDRSVELPWYNDHSFGMSLLRRMEPMLGREIIAVSPIHLAAMTSTYKVFLFTAQEKSRRRRYELMGAA